MAAIVPGLLVVLGLALVGAQGAVLQRPADLPARYDTLWPQLVRPADAASGWDPARVTHRLGACVAVLEATEHCLFGADGQRGNPFWGILLQTAWQYLSGRHLVDPASGATIDPESWWAVNNYFLTVAPYLAAAGSGAVPDVRPQPLVNGHGAVYPQTASDCAVFGHAEATCAVFAHWRAFVEGVRASRTVWCGNGTRSSPGLAATATATAARDELDRLAGLLWAAHQAALRTTVPVVDQLRGAHLPPLERRFAYMWAMAVAEALAEMRLLTDYPLTVHMQELIVPWRVLGSEDDPLADLAPASRGLVLALAALHRVDGWLPLAGVMNAAVRAGMCSPAQRARGGALAVTAIERLDAPAQLAAAYVGILLGAIADPDCGYRSPALATTLALAVALAALLYARASRSAHVHTPK
jgi:hypothetical protein